MHGIALNVNALMKGFEMIVPCGIKVFSAVGCTSPNAGGSHKTQDREVTSLHQILGDSCPSVEEVFNWNQCYPLLISFQVKLCLKDEFSKVYLQSIKHFF